MGACQETQAVAACYELVFELDKHMVQDPIFIPRTWRSEWVTLLVAAGGALAATVFTYSALGAALNHEILREQLGFGLELAALIWIFPLAALLRAAYGVYNVRYSLDHHAIEVRSGRLAWSLLITRIRYQDIRSIETRQSVVDQVLGIGRIEIGTAASSGAEVLLSGIADPRRVQQAIQEERSNLEND